MTVMAFDRTKASIAILAWLCTIRLQNLFSIETHPNVNNDQQRLMWWIHRNKVWERSLEQVIILNCRGNKKDAEDCRLSVVLTLINLMSSIQIYMNSGLRSLDGPLKELERLEKTPALKGY